MIKKQENIRCTKVAKQKANKQLQLYHVLLFLFFYHFYFLLFNEH